MTIIELKEKRNDLLNELNGMVETAKAETRKLNDDEENRKNEIKQQIADVDEQIRAAEKENEELSKRQNNNVEKTIEKMSLIKAINDVASNRSLDEATQNEINEAKAEFRKSGLSVKGQIQLRNTIKATVATDGKENVPEEKMGIELALRNNIVATKLGASFLGGLVGDVSIPKYAGSTVGWADETEAAQDAAGKWEEITLSPKRITAYVDVSKQFLLQDSNDAEAMLMNDLAKAISEKLDETIFGDGEGSTKQPKGLMNGVSATTSLDAIDYKTVLKMEEAIEEKNGNDYMFVCSPSVKFALKGVQKANALGMILEGNEIDGINYVSSNSVKKNGIIAFDPRSLVIAQWGGVDILVDPYTQAASGMVRLVVNCYFDAAMKSDRIKAELFS